MPVTCEKGTYFHMMKTGGTWFTQILTEQFGGKVIGRGGHLPVSAYPDLARPYFGTWREPFSWYGSLYKHVKRSGMDASRWGKTATGDWVESMKFRSFLHGLTHPWLVTDFGERNTGVAILYLPVDPDKAVSQLRQHRQGFWSWCTSYTYGLAKTAGEPDPVWGVDLLIPQKKLNEGMSALLGGFETPARPAVNSSEHIKTEYGDKKYAEWYDDEMRGWVMEADGRLLTRLA